jgi:hypothetical protein
MTLEQAAACLGILRGILFVSASISLQLAVLTLVVVMRGRR